MVATRNRLVHVQQLLQVLTEQTLQPVGVVVVDSSDPPLDFAQLTRDEAAFAIKPATSTRASLPYQRNCGVDIALEAFEPDAICFLDDDVRPHRDYLARLAGALGTGAEVAGASGTSGWTDTQLPLLRTLYERTFLLSGPADGRVLASGHNRPVDARLGGVQRAQWLFGCSMWRAGVFKDHRFHADLPGSALYEDVEFSVRVGRRRVLLVDCEAKLDHLLETSERPAMGLHYERLVRNRAEVLKALDAGPVSWFAFWWSVVGEALMLARYSRTSPGYRERLAGLFRGVRATILRRSPR